MTENYQANPGAGDDDQNAQEALSIDENGVMRNDAHDAPEALTGVSSAPSGRTTAIPDGAKRPQDHRKAAKRTVIVNGMDLKVDIQQLRDDWELMELMAEMEGTGDEENLPLVIKMVKTVLGDQYGMVKDNCKIDGRVSTEKMMAVIQRVFEEVGELGE